MYFVTATLQLLLCLAEHRTVLSEEPLLGILAAHDVSVDSIEVVDVPKYNAVRDEQYVEWNKTWPLGTRPPPR